MQDVEDPRPKALAFLAYCERWAAELVSANSAYLYIAVAVSAICWTTGRRDILICR